MNRKPTSPKPLSKTAEVELQELIAICRRYRLTVADLRKIKRIVRIMFESQSSS